MGLERWLVYYEGWVGGGLDPFSLFLSRALSLSEGGGQRMMVGFQ